MQRTSFRLLFFSILVCLVPTLVAAQEFFMHIPPLTDEEIARAEIREEFALLVKECRSTRTLEEFAMFNDRFEQARWEAESEMAEAQEQPAEVRRKIYEKNRWQTGEMLQLINEMREHLPSLSYPDEYLDAATKEGLEPADLLDRMLELKPRDNRFVAMGVWNTITRELQRTNPDPDTLEALFLMMEYHANPSKTLNSQLWANVVGFYPDELMGIIRDPAKLANFKAHLGL